MTDGPSPVAPGPDRHGSLWAVPASGWLPAGCVLTLIAVILHRHDVALLSLAAFGLYLLLGIALPGTLLLRALRGRSEHVATDVAAGSALGYALEVLTYIPARWAGLPLLFLLWPATTLIAFLAVPRLRRHWRGNGLRAPVWWTWTVATIIGLVTLSSGSKMLQVYGLTRLGSGYSDNHLLFHLAIIGELKHHMPPTSSWVHGEPLHYHWFVCADMAATSWATGIEPIVLLHRLSVPAMIAAFSVLLAALAHRLSGRWWTGPTVLVLAYLMVSPHPAGSIASVEGLLLAQSSVFLWFGPSLPFGALLFAATIMVAIDLLGDERRARTWILFTTLLTAVMGAKAVYLPLLLAGLLTAAAIHLFLHRRAQRQLLHMAAIVLVALTFAQIVLYGGANNATVFEPGLTLRFFGFQFLPGQDPAGASAVLLMTFLLGWTCLWAGLGGLFLRPRARLTPPIGMFLGIGLAGLAAMFTLFHPGSSHLYFTRGATPYLAIASVCGLAAVLPDRLTTRRVLSLLGAAIIGAACAAVYAGASGAYATFPALVLVAACAAGGLVVIGRRSSAHRRIVAACAITLFTALTVPASLGRTSEIVRGAVRPDEATPQYARLISPGAFAAARWLRAHSDPDDLVATNAHCGPPPPQRCQSNLHLSVTALTERRVLLEGFAWTETATSRFRRTTVPGAYREAPFWDQRLLATNDAAFRTPSTETIGRLRNGHGVRWLFADGGVPGLSPRLGAYATLRFRSGRCAVYELTP